MPRRKGGDIYIYKAQSPCYQCPRRWRTNTQSCHDTCKEYQDYRRDVGNEYNQRVAANRKNDEIYGHISGKSKNVPAR